MIGIGITTCNRLAALQACLDSIRRHTPDPHVLLVADDGSTDGTREWLHSQNCGSSYANRGLPWNRNRLLHGLFARGGCDVAVMLDDDCTVGDGWLSLWAEAARRWGHVDYAYDLAAVVSGDGTALSPYRTDLAAGCCSATSRQVFDWLGYQDTRFVGWGFEDSDWTRRFLRGAGLTLAVALRAGVEHACLGTFLTTEKLARNRLVFDTTARDPIYRLPWSSEQEREAFLREFA
jgi:GT2 family glycosyltransferase